MHQGEIWWGGVPDAKPRPLLVLSRERAIESLRGVLVAPVTRTVRGLASEVQLGQADGLAVACVASMDNVTVMPKALLTRRIGRIAAGRWHEVCAAVQAAIDC